MTGTIKAKGAIPDSTWEEDEAEQFQFFEVSTSFL
jgi:hypothetical protein